MPLNELGRFEIVSELGHSDLTSVYLAKDPREERTVVLRTMRLEASDPAATARAARFFEDAARVCTLDSPNIAAFYDHGESDGHFYLACEYVVGESLRKQIDENKDFSLNDILDLTRQVCSAFDHAHSRGIAACGLKPARFVMESDGTLKIMDFALNETTGEDHKEALHYSSPEQLRGEKPDLRSNLFSWGAVLYEVVTGQKAFPGFDEESIRESVLESVPQGPEDLLPGMPPGVSAAIMKAMKKHLNDRYVRGSEMVRALEDYKNYKAAEETELPFMLQQHVRAGAASRPASDDKPSPRVTAAAVTSAPHTTAPSAEIAGACAPALAIDDNARGTEASGARFPALRDSDWVSADSAKPSSDARNPNLILSEYAPAKTPNKAAPPKTTARALAQMAFHSQATEAPSPTKTVARPLVDPAGPGMPPRASGSPKVNLSHKTRLLVYASIAVFAALTALFSAGTAHRRNRPVSQTPVAPVSPVSTDPAFSEPFAPKQAAPQQAAAPATPPQQEMAMEIEPTPSAIKKTKRGAPPQPTKVVTTPMPVPGDLSVATTPAGARVQVDGRGDSEWVTPCVIAGLPPGQHTLTVSKPGFAAASRSFEIAAGTRAEVSLPMSQLGATLAVSSNPAGATIFVDGKNVGRATPAQVLLSQGKHQVTVQKPGYLEVSTIADFTSGQVFKFEPALKAMGNIDSMRPAGKMTKLFGKGTPEGMGRVQIRSNPHNAQISLNNRVLDRFTPADLFLDPGSYQMTLSLPGYKSVQKVITVESGGKVLIEETLVQ